MRMIQRLSDLERFVWHQVYTVGPDYAHAEARKSPALDGKVERDSEGKEVRYPVMLSAMEKLVARKVCLAFKVSKGNGSDVVWFPYLFCLCGQLHLHKSERNMSTSQCSKLFVASTFSEPMDTLMCVMSTVLVSWRTQWSTMTTVPRSSGTILSFCHSFFTGTFFSPELALIYSSLIFRLFVALQEHRDAWAGSSVSDSLVYSYWGRGHPHRSHHFRDHVSHHSKKNVAAKLTKSKLNH